jgi:hypothetical protein
VPLHEERAYAGIVNTIHLSDAELAIVRNAVNGYLNSFGHNEADVVELVKQVLAKLAAAEHDDMSEAG